MRVIKVESENIEIKSKGETEDHLIAVIGLEDVLVVHSEDATIIAKKSEGLQEQLIDLLISLEKKKKT